MSKISVLILTKNEEKNITDCLKSVAWADEIIIVDDYSEDGTSSKLQAPSSNIQFFRRHLNGDFAEQRNFALSKASSGWVLYLDADERVTPELAKEIQQVTSRVSPVTAFRLQRKNYYFGQHQWPHIETVTRLFKKESLKGWRGQLHESPVVEGEIDELGGFLLHYTHQDLSSMLENTLKWSEIEAELRLKANHPPMTWWRFPRVMLTEFAKYYFGQGGWKSGTVGLMESIYQSFSIFITYARLWEKQQHARTRSRLRRTIATFH